MARRSTSCTNPVAAVLWAWACAALPPARSLIRIRHRRRVYLKARRGPFGTANYRISLEAVGLEDERTFIHLRYSYTYGFAGRLAMKVYLASSGSDRVGFTVIGDPNDLQPKFIGGVRGALERNTMRYYLAIDAYLGALAPPTPADGRFEQSLERWFSATELYPRQLCEIDRDTYFAMKRSEYPRHHAAHDRRGAVSGAAAQAGPPVSAGRHRARPP